MRDESGRLREQLRDSNLVIQILLSKLGGECVVSDGEVTSWQPDLWQVTMDRRPTDDARVLKLRPA